MYTKIIQDTKFVYIWHKKVVQTKIQFDNEKINVQEMYIKFLHIYKKCTNYTKPIYN